MITVWKTNRFAIQLLLVIAVSRAIPGTGVEDDDYTDAAAIAAGADCPCLSHSIKVFAIRLHNFERRVTSTRMLSTSIPPSPCKSTLTKKESEDEQVSEGGSRKLQDMKDKLDTMTNELGQLQGKYAGLQGKYVGLQDRVGQLAGYVDTVAKKLAPATCQELRQLGLAKSGWYPIDPDGAGVGEDPISVFCDMRLEGGIRPRGVTRITHNLDNQTVEVASCKGQGCHITTNVTYNASMIQIRHLINISDKCTQKIQYNCLSAPLTKAVLVPRSEINMGSWRGVDGAKNVYWHGSHHPNDHLCACHTAGICVDQEYPCNCDSLQVAGSEWKSDAGVLTNKTALPVVELTFGVLSRGKEKQAANFTLGSLECSSSGMLHDISLMDKAGADPDPSVQLKRAKVKEMMRHAWQSYAKHAWGHDYLVAGFQGRGRDDSTMEGLGTTIVEALDTLFLMGLEEEFERGVAWVQKELPAKFNQDIQRRVRDVTWRILGGLLSSYAFSGDVRLFRAAVDLANRLLPAFDSKPSGIPPFWISTMPREYHDSFGDLEHFGSLHLEFAHLSQLTGNSKYVDKVMKFREVLQVGARINGLYSSSWYTDNGYPGKVLQGWLGKVRFYDTLLKSWLISGGEDQKALDMFSGAIEAVTNNVLQESKSKMLYVPCEATHPDNFKFDRRMHHDSCFWGGLYALWAHKMAPTQPSPHAPPPGRVETNRTMASHSMMNIGRRLAATCRRAYDRTETKLGPGGFVFGGNASEDAKAYYRTEAELREPTDFTSRREWEEHDFLWRDAIAYKLWHEAVESYFLLWRLTGNKKYREWGWDVVQAIETHCRRAVGFSGIKDVNKVDAQSAGSQESWFLGATLKYLYLLFSSGDLLPLDQWVFNPAGHPLPITEDGTYSST